ncbi:CBS domain-containing protein [Nonomuraea jabiensis]|uniref:CBS domain-containing protein n=1 Tax=Nonomuraea jabiensis TaxID=882448 RepID=UPI0036945EE9
MPGCAVRFRLRARGQAARTMAGHKVRRLPVIDGQALVGIVALADVANAVPDATAGDLLESLTSDRQRCRRYPRRPSWRGYELLFRNSPSPGACSATWRSVRCHL